MQPLLFAAAIVVSLLEPLIDIVKSSDESGEVIVSVGSSDDEDVARHRIPTLSQQLQNCTILRIAAVMAANGGNTDY